MIKVTLVLAVAVFLNSYAAGSLLKKAEVTLHKLKTFEKAKELEDKLITEKDTTSRTVLGPVKYAPVVEAQLRSNNIQGRS